MIWTTSSTTWKLGAVDDWLKEYASGKYKTMKLKNGTRKVWGTLIIKNFHEDHFPALNISRLEGSMYIENCSAEDLTGLFAEESFLTNDLHITKCDNLTDMTGAPFHVGGWLYVTACMKSREGMIDNSDAGLARYARAQKSRYAGIITKNKAMKGYKKRTEATAKLFERYANFIRKTAEDLDWYSDHLSETANVYKAFGVNSYSFEKGLPYIYRLWIGELKDLTKYDVPSVNGYEDQLDKCIAAADKALSDAGC